MEQNPELDVTLFVNILDEPFTFHVNNEPRVLKAHEEKPMPLYVAQLGAKHLVDYYLQKQGVKNTLADSELRKSIFAKILPEMASERNIKPLTVEEELKAIKEEQGKQKELVASIVGQTSTSDEVEKLRAEIEELKKQVLEKPLVEGKIDIGLPKRGRKPKAEVTQ